VHIGLLNGGANGMEVDWKEREVDLGLLVWKKRGFRIRERIQFSSGMGGMKMEVKSGSAAGASR